MIVAAASHLPDDAMKTALSGVKFPKQRSKII
jgi:hypothetical protein